MFFSFVDELRAADIPASLKEHLVLLEALDKDVIEATPEAFYYLSRATFVKDEGLLDRFDQVFAKVFRGIDPDIGIAWTLAGGYQKPRGEVNPVLALHLETLRQALRAQRGRVLRGFRQAAGLSLADLARRVEAPVAAVRRWEAGGLVPDAVAPLQALAAELDLPLDLA